MAHHLCFSFIANFLFALTQHELLLTNIALVIFFRSPSHKKYFIRLLLFSNDTRSSPATTAQQFAYFWCNKIIYKYTEKLPIFFAEVAKMILIHHYSMESNFNVPRTISTNAINSRACGHIFSYRFLNMLNGLDTVDVRFF